MRLNLAKADISYSSLLYLSKCIFLSFDIKDFDLSSDHQQQHSEEEKDQKLIWHI